MGKLSEKPREKTADRLDLPIREIRQLFELHKGIRISNRLAYQIQDALAHGEGEPLGPVLTVDGVRVHFAVNGLPGLNALRRIMLYRCLIKSRLEDGHIDLRHTAAFLRMQDKGPFHAHEILRRRLLLEGISLSADGREVRFRGGFSFEELSFDFEAPSEGLDISEFGRKLLVAVYEFHDCSVGGTAHFFHTNEQLMGGILRRAGVNFEVPAEVQHFELPADLSKQFGSGIHRQLIERLQMAMAEILRTAKARAARKKLANRQFLDEMEERIRAFIQLVMVPEFGSAVLSDERASALHAAAWHFLQWEISQLPVEDIIHLEIVSPYEMMMSRVLKNLGLTHGGCPAFFSKDYSTTIHKDYAPLVLTPECMTLLFRCFKTADLFGSSFHSQDLAHSSQDGDTNRTLLELEMKQLQRFAFEIPHQEVGEKLERSLTRLGSVPELRGVLTVEVKQVLTALQEILEHPDIQTFGIGGEHKTKLADAIRKSIDGIQGFIRDPGLERADFPTIARRYLETLQLLQTLCREFRELTEPGRDSIATWASLSELYRTIYTVKGLNPPTSRRKKQRPAAGSERSFPMLQFGPHLQEIPPEILIRTTFVYPTDSFEKLNLIPPHLRTFLIVDEPNNHVGQYHLAAWAFRIHWKRRRLGHGQKLVADDFIRSLRFLRAFAFRRDQRSEPRLVFCNVDSEIFGQAKLAGGTTVLEKSRTIAQQALGIPSHHILELNQSEEPANEHDKYALFLDRLY